MVSRLSANFALPNRFLRRGKTRLLTVAPLVESALRVYPIGYKWVASHFFTPILSLNRSTSLPPTLRHQQLLVVHLNQTLGRQKTACSLMF